MAEPYPIPHFIGGVSTQPEAQRVPGQVSAADNVFLPLERGCTKRNGTIPIHTSRTNKDLNLVVNGSNPVYYHWIDRDSSRRYLVVFSPSASSDNDLIQVFDIVDGSRKTVQFDTLTYNGVTYNPKNYINVTGGKIKAVTVGDTTFILNTNVTTASVGSATLYNNATICPIETAVNAGGRELKIGNVDQMTVRKGTQFKIVGYPSTTYTVNYTVSADSVTDTIEKLRFSPGLAVNVTAANSIEFVDTSVDQSANQHYRNSYLDLPNVPGTNNEYWYTAVDTVGNPSGYYKTQNNGTIGPKYVRVHSPAANWGIDPVKMPIKMMYNAQYDRFDVSCITWAERLSGDNDTNPVPKFINKKIEDMVFHQDRLWFAYEDRVMGSVSGDYYNFWLDNWRVVGDSDPCEIGTTGDRVSFIRHMVSFGVSLLLFCTGNMQFEVRGGQNQAVTPSSIGAYPSTQNSVDLNCRPHALSDRIYFLSKEEPYKLYEYYYSLDNFSNTTTDVSLHVQNYLPSNPIEIRASDANNFVACLFGEEQNRLYVHYIIVAGSEKVQSAWCRWSFGTDSIQSFWVYDNWLYLVLKRGTQYFLEKMYLGVEANDSNMPFAAKLDKRFTVTGTYNSTTKETSWVLPFNDPEYSRLILGPNFGISGSKKGFEKIVTQSVNNQNQTVLTTSGDYSAGPCWVGRPYNVYLKIPDPFVRDQTGRVVPGVINILNFRIIHKDTGYYQINITPEKRETKSFIFNPVRVGSAVLGSINIESNGEFYCKPMVSSGNMSMTIESSSHLPMTLVSGNLGIRFIATKRNPAR